MTKKEWEIITNVFACLADDVHEGAPEDYECTEAEARAISDQALAEWKKAVS